MGATVLNFDRQQAVDDETLLQRLTRRAELIRSTQPEVAEAVLKIVLQESTRHIDKSAPVKVVRQSCLLWAARIASEHFGVTTEAVLSEYRTRSSAAARAIAMGLCMARWDWSMSEVANGFGVDHSTASYAIRKAKRTEAWALVEAEDRRHKAEK